MSPGQALKPEAQAALAELQRRRQLDPIGELYPLQRDIVTHPARYKVWLAGARSGKTFASVRKLYRTAIRYPGSECLYVGLSRPSAEKLAWGPLLKMCKDREHLMPFEAHKVKLEITLANGSTITVAGAPDSRTIERFRGVPYRDIVIDECASYGTYLDYLVGDIFGPRLEDYQGAIMLVGTPSGNCEGLFYRASIGEIPKYTRFHSTVLDNPMFPQWRGRADWKERARAHLRQILIEEGITEDNPTYRREWKAEWVPEDDDLLHHIPEACWMPQDQLPGWNKEKGVPEDLTRLLGIDMGFFDDTSFVVTGYGQVEPGFYEVDSEYESKLSLTQIVQTANRLVGRYAPEAIVVDPAAGGMHLVSELAQRYSIPCLPADKQHKASWITLLQDDFAHVRAHLLAGGRTGEQARLLRWNKQRTREREGMPCDNYDAYLYPYRYGYHWIHKERPRELSIEEQIEREALEQARRARQDEDWY